MSKFIIFLAWLAYFVIGLIFGLFPTYVIADVADKYHIEFIQQFSFAQLFAVIQIASLILFRRSDDDEEETEEEKIKKGFSDMGYRLLFVLCWWGLLYLMHYFIR